LRYSAIDSHADLAAAYRFGVRTMQEWERGANRPRGPARPVPHTWEIEAMLVRDVMREPISVHAEETLEVATLRMKKENVGALPVVEDDQVVGMITDRDVLLRGFPEGRNIDTKTRESMSVGPILCHEEDTLEHALEIMSHNHVRRLPVLGHNERLVGILSVNDLTASSSKPAALEVVFYRQLPDSTGHVHNVQLTRVAVARGRSRSEAVQAAIEEFEKERKVAHWSLIAHGYDILPAGEAQDR
jgi:predicted transcriptional regulator